MFDLRDLPPITEAPNQWARALQISGEALEIYLASDVIDLHVDSFIWKRVFGYDLGKTHGQGALAAHFYSQADLPRLRHANITGAIWVITTNPARTAKGRKRAFENNLRNLKHEMARYPDQMRLVRNVAEYKQARAEGLHGAFIGIQGGNALDIDLDALDAIADNEVLRITLVHLSSSKIGTTSSPLTFTPNRGLSTFGKDYVKRLNEKKIFLDLAHINRAGFFDALEASDPSHPVLVTHTGVKGVHEHWRNLDDEQIRAIADTGGTIGIMYQASFLGDPVWAGKASSIVEHLAHIVKVVGPEYASLGSDWDGAISPPRDMRTCLELPKLVQLMLDRGLEPDSIQKILGQNFLRVVERLRG